MPLARIDPVGLRPSEGLPVTGQNVDPDVTSQSARQLQRTTDRRDRIFHLCPRFCLDTLLFSANSF